VLAQVLREEEAAGRVTRSESGSYVLAVECFEPDLLQALRDLGR
jgi:hypothetical protein